MTSLAPVIRKVLLNKSLFIYFSTRWRMVCCVAFGCKNHQDRQTIRDGKKISYFNIPNPEKERHRAQIWLKNIGTGFTLKTFKFTKNKRVCSDHFHENCYEIDRNAVLGYETTKRRLKEGAVPTIFAHKVFEKINMNGETVTIRPPKSLKRVQETAQKEVRHDFSFLSKQITCGF